MLVNHPLGIARFEGRLRLTAGDGDAEGNECVPQDVMGQSALFPDQLELRLEPHRQEAAIVNL